MVLATWDLNPLLATDAEFDHLETFSVGLTQPADHNRTILGSDFEEDGVAARLLAKSPRLERLTIPSAPNADFFNVGARPLKFLSVDAGYDTQGFILKLAQSSCFPQLECLEWGEYNETYMDGFVSSCTPLADYQQLFRSQTFQGVRRLVWRNPVCSDSEINELQVIRPDLQLLVVRWSQHYVR